MKKWVYGVLLTLIILIIAAVSFTVLNRPNTRVPNFQVTNVSISKPTIREWSNLIFDGVVIDGLSFYYTARESVTCRLTFNNYRYLATKTVALTHFSANDTEIIDTFTIPPYAQNSRSFELLTGQTFSGYIEISGTPVNDMHVNISYTNYTQSIDFSFNLVNSGSSDGFAVVELRSDDVSVWSNRYTVRAGGNERETGTVKIPDKYDHTFLLTVIQQF